MKIIWTDKKSLHSSARNFFQNADIVLDIGCGINPQQLLKTKVNICCEPYQEYIIHLQQKISSKKHPKYVILNLTWAQAINIFPPKSVDTVVLYDVIEHLSKAEGKRLLKLTEKIVRKQIIIFTPLGYIKQEHPDGKDAWGLHGVKWQEHHSGWLPSDFGTDWQCLGCKKYHFVNQFSQKLPKPHGALYAIKTLPQTRKEKTFFDVFSKIFTNLAHA